MMSEQIAEFEMKALYGQPLSDYHHKVQAMWLRYGVLEPERAARRMTQIVAILLDGDEIVGVTTAAVRDFERAGHRYFFMRMFIRPERRGSNAVRSRFSRFTRDVLKQVAAPDYKIQGVIIVVENKKFSRPAMKRQLKRNGWHYVGVGQKGNDIWCERFDGLELISPIL